MIRLRERAITGTHWMDCRAAIGTRPRVWDESVSIPRHAPPTAGPRLMLHGPDPCSSRMSIVSRAHACCNVQGVYRTWYRECTVRGTGAGNCKAVASVRRASDSSFNARFMHSCATVRQTDHVTQASDKSSPHARGLRSVRLDTCTDVSSFFGEPSCGSAEPEGT